MTDHRAAPNSSVPPHPWGVGEALSQMRSYSDDAALQRVWNRLESRRRFTAGPAPVPRLIAAAALLAVGVGLGIFYERVLQGAGPEVAQVDSEVLAAPESPAGPIGDRARFASPERKVEPTPRPTSRRARHSVARRGDSVVPLEDQSEAEGIELEEEVGVPETEELSSPPKATWLVLAERGDYAGAFQQLDESGGFDSVLASGSSEELMTLVEVARFVGRQGRAVQALRAVTERHRGDPNAPIAAMMLGNLLSRAGDAEGAAEAYALNRRLSPGGDFAEDALVREFDMAMAASDLPRVEQLLGQYEAEFPNGKHLDELRGEANRLAGEVPASHVASQRAGKSAQPEADAGADPDESLDSGAASGNADETVEKVAPSSDTSGGTHAAP